MEFVNKVADEDPTYAVPYDPEARKKHRWESLFLDIPMTMSRGPDGLYVPTEGAMMLPHTAARIAEHVELVGFSEPSAELAKVRRVSLPRGASRWQDVRADVPDVDPVDAVHVAASAVLTPAEKAALIDRLRDDISDLGDRSEQ